MKSLRLATGFNREAGFLVAMMIGAWLRGAVAVSAEPQSAHAASLETAALRVLVTDNEAYGEQHRAGYNGVADLRLTGPDQKNLFVPFYSGLNLEHIFSGDASSYGWSIFEPRRVPLQLVHSTTNRVELLQARTENWPLSSHLVYEIQGDAIDFTYRGTPLADVWQKHGYVGVFFASYINAPADLSIQFIGRSRAGRGDTRPRWIKHLPPSHGVAASHRPAGSDWDPPYDAGFPITLASGHSDFEYSYPFYFGRQGDQVFILMFARPDKGAEVRFAQSPTGGGSGNPAWDYLFLQRDYAVNREFQFRARAVYRKFTNVADIARIYQAWSGEKVELPGAP